MLNSPCRFVGLTGISTSSQRSSYLNPVLGCLQGKYLQRCSVGGLGLGFAPASSQGVSGGNILFLQHVLCPLCCHGAVFLLTQNDNNPEATNTSLYQAWAGGWAPAGLRGPPEPKDDTSEDKIRIKYVPLSHHNEQHDFAPSFFCLWKILVAREGPEVPREHPRCAAGEPVVSSV